MKKIEAGIAVEASSLDLTRKDPPSSLNDHKKKHITSDFL
jgi:hypothetical protein